MQHLKQNSLGDAVQVLCLATYSSSGEQSSFELTAPDFDAAGNAILKEAERRAGKN